MSKMLLITERGAIRQRPHYERWSYCSHMTLDLSTKSRHKKKVEEAKLVVTRLHCVYSANPTSITQGGGV